MTDTLIDYNTLAKYEKAFNESNNKIISLNQLIKVKNLTIINLSFWLKLMILGSAFLALFLIFLLVQNYL